MSFFSLRRFKVRYLATHRFISRRIALSRDASLISRRIALSRDVSRYLATYRVVSRRIADFATYRVISRRIAYLATRSILLWCDGLVLLFYSVSFSLCLSDLFINVASASVLIWKQCQKEFEDDEVGTLDFDLLREDGGDEYIAWLVEAQVHRCVVSGVRTLLSEVTRDDNRAIYTLVNFNNRQLQKEETYTLVEDHFKEVWMSPSAAMKKLIEAVPRLSKRKYRVQHRDNMYKLDQDLRLTSRRLTIKKEEQVNVVADADADANANASGDADANGDANGDADADANANGDADANANGNAVQNESEKNEVPRKKGADVVAGKRAKEIKLVARKASGRKKVKPTVGAGTIKHPVSPKKNKKKRKGRTKAKTKTNTTPPKTPPTATTRRSTRLKSQSQSQSQSQKKDEDASQGSKEL